MEGDEDGWEEVIGKGCKDLNHDDTLSSAKVKDGCTLKLYNDANGISLLDTLTSDLDTAVSAGHNDIVSSVYCSCKGTYNPYTCREY